MGIKYKNTIDICSTVLIFFDNFLIFLFLRFYIGLDPGGLGAALVLTLD